MTQGRRVVITGVGPLLSLGIGRQSVIEGLGAVRTGLTLHTELLDGTSWESFYLHEVPAFDITEIGLEPSVLEEIFEARNASDDRDLQYLISCVKLALDDSRLVFDPHNNNIGVILTHENPGLDRYTLKIINELYNCLKSPSFKTAPTPQEVADYLYKRYSTTVYDLQTFMYLYYVCRTFGCHGFSIFINNACASGLYAIESASSRIRAGKNDIMIIAAADHPLRPFKYRWFKELGLYASDGKIKPFDRKRNGFVLGDGAGAIVLEDLSHAVKRGAHIYAEYLGGGFSLDSWKVTVPDVDGDYYLKALREALYNSEVRPEEIDLVNPHGVGTSLGDRYEARVINDVFVNSSKQPLISAFKPLLGHTLGGSALTETILLLLCIDTSNIPPTMNVDEVDPELKIKVVTQATQAKVKIAVKMANGFAGYNAAAVFRKVDSA